MEVLHNPVQLKSYVERYGIEKRFATSNLQFRLLRFERGEFLTAPNKRLDEILFLVEGNVQIYHVHTDGSVSPVAPVYPGDVFGDMEFATGNPTAFYSEVMNTVLCVGLSLSRYREILKQDEVFLFGILRSLGNKMEDFMMLETSSQSLDGQVLFYLEHFCPQGCMHSVNEAVLHLHCSRRQLQRVLKKLCDDGRIEKQRRGTYRLMPQRMPEQ